jgi:hypothetical protein
MSLFDESIIHALPLTNAKKKFTRLSFEESVALFTKITGQLDYLNTAILSGVLYLEELLTKLQFLSAQKPCSLVHFIAERAVITEPSGT